VVYWSMIAVLTLAADESIAKEIESLTRSISLTPKDVDLYSKRGDLYFQTREFTKSLADYEKMVELNPRLDVTHWRKGIVLYYLGRWEDSAKQFEKYQSIDDVDRENGIWRFLAMQKKVGTKKARDEMIQYTRVDRPPLTDVYRLFQGELSAEEFAKKAASFGENSKERFYAELYLGLYFDGEGDSAKALEHLRSAEKNRWAKSSTGGPGWMWHIARVHAMKVEQDSKAKNPGEQPSTTKKAA
jgi:lipoprotein NlpI